MAPQLVSIALHLFVCSHYLKHIECSIHIIRHTHSDHMKIHIKREKLECGTAKKVTFMSQHPQI